MCVGLAARQDAQPPAAPPTTTSTAPASAPGTTSQQPSKQRVYLRVNRNVDARGTLEYEDADIIVIRDLEGSVQSFGKTRIAQIVRLVDPEPGQNGVVVMLDRQIREGVIVEDHYDYVLVEIEGIRAHLKRSLVSHVVLSPTVEQRYREYKAALQPGMHDAHYHLCQWLAEEKRFELARDELLLLLEQVEMPEARRLLTIVGAQLALLAPARPSNRTNGDAAGGDNGAMGAPGDGRRSGTVREEDLLPRRLLTSEEVNLIRVYEVDFDHPPRLSISPDAVRTLIEKYGTNNLVPASQTGRNAMFRAAADDPIQIVRLMFELRARDLYPLVQVNSEPYSLNLFRQRVHDTWLINTCATTACHGSPFAGRFFLHRKNYKEPEVRYTNLMILERLQIDPDWPLINYQTPENSLIIQYALPRELARKPHPLVRGFRAAISPTNQRMKQDAIAWVESMMQPRPIVNGLLYGVDYEPPELGGGAAPVDLDQPPGRVPR